MFRYYFLLLSIAMFSQNKLSNNQKFYKLSIEELEKAYKAKDTTNKSEIVELMLYKSKKEKNYDKIIKGYFLKSLLSKNKNLSIKYLDSMFYLANNHFEIPNILATCYYRKAYFYCKNRNYKTALENYILANNNLKKEDDEKLYYAIQFDIAIIKSSMFNYKEALPIFIEFYEYSKKNKNINSESISLYAIAESYNRLGNIEKAKFFTKLGKKTSINLHDKQRYDKFVLCDGMNYYQEKKYNTAIDVLSSVLKNLKYDFANYSTTAYYIGKSYHNINKKDVGIKYFEKVDSIFVKEKEIYFETIKAYNYIIDFYKSKKNIKKQLYYTNNLIKADSTLLSNYDYLTKKIHKEYEIPKLLNEKKELEKKVQSNKYLYLMIIIIGAIFFIFYIIYTKRRQNIAFKKYLEKHKNKSLYINDNNKTINEQIDIIFNINSETNIENNVLETKNDTHSNKNINIYPREEIFENILTEETRDVTNEFNKLNFQESKVQESKVQEILKGLDKFIENKGYLSSDCNLDSVAKELQTNTTYLSNVVNEIKGCNFPTYINNLRIEYALERFENDKQFRKYDMESIANELGYNNANSFSRAFKKHTKMNPSFFIKQLNITSNL